MTDTEKQAEAMLRQAEAAPLAAAHLAATVVASRLLPPGKGKGAGSWPMLCAGATKKAKTEADVAAIATLAPFVRANPDAPAEALYRHAASAGVHTGAADGFAEQPLAVRFAYDTFRRTLVAIDQALDAERAKNRPAGAPPPKVPIEDTIFEETEEFLAQVSFGPSPAKKAAAATQTSTKPAAKTAAKSAKPAPKKTGRK